MMMVTLPSGKTVNLTQITHAAPVTWVVWPQATEPKIHKTGLDIHFVGGSFLRLEEPDASQFLTMLQGTI